VKLATAKLQKVIAHWGYTVMEWREKFLPYRPSQPCSIATWSVALEGRIVHQHQTISSPLLAIMALASGAALVVAILWKISLALGLIAFAVAVVPIIILRVSRMSTQIRARIRRQVLYGMLVGLVATAAYDLTRLLLCKLGRLSFWPFETFVLFGLAIAGADTPRSTAFVIGTIYHVANGVGFAVSYCLLLGGRPWLYGLIWALGLELAMFTLYPGWLDLRAVMVEFTVVSVTGHLAYGMTLGTFSQHLLGRRQTQIKR
jgi:hypothetical protein